MPRLDIYPIPSSGSQGYVVNVQADLLSHLSTRTVVPLLPEEMASKPIADLNPVFDIEGKRHVMITQAIASIPLSDLRRPAGTLIENHDRITRALDILLLGF